MNNNIITEPSANLRALGREALRGNWKLAAVATLVYMVAMLIPVAILDALFGGAEGISAMSGLYTLLITGPFTLGYSIFCLALFRKQDAEVAQVFYGFERFGRAFLLYLVMSIFIFLWTLLLIVPGIIAAIRYSQAFLVMVDNPNLGVMDCLEESKRMMRGNKAKYFCLALSFIGWAILCALPAGIVGGVVTSILINGGTVGLLAANLCYYVCAVGYLWLTPYVMVTMVGFYEMLTGALRPGVTPAVAQVIDDGYAKDAPFGGGETKTAEAQQEETAETYKEE